ncbi:predicted protein [Naegleria gruberi]|uniref:Predicted protein n=1 Tax=Naegleria gruberi TaxID=5762 RepID=D2VH16_NAEGR|nr:uncharacterized protein NAEGRDRAFT_49519 [Naegleria gruberi]EFC43905.1 predicted protein [Naegleria gruberi]|eukprot:XP_002676649.1 predicted protein [Naegleria gruberi strain NEG-M]
MSSSQHQGGAFRLVQLEIKPLQKAHNENTTTMLENIELLTTLAKDIEGSSLPDDPEYERNKIQVEQIDSIVRDYLDLLRMTKGHTATLQQILESPGIDLRTVSQFYDNNIKTNTEKEYDDQSIKKVEEYQNFKLSIMQVHDPTAELDWNQEGDDDDDIQLSQVTIKTTCPWTGSNLQEPIQSKKCKHVYEKTVAFQKLRTGGGFFECPIIGCRESRITEADLVESPSLTFKIRKEIKRQEEEKRKKTESAAVDLSDDDE